MKRINILLVFFLLIYACKGQNKETTSEGKTNIASNFSSLGAEIDVIGALHMQEMTGRYKNLVVFDTLSIQFSTKVTEVCQVKGC